MFTLAERTVKKHTVGQAVQQALLYLKQKHNLTQVCTDMVKNRTNEEAITVAEMSQIVEDLVFDTLYWERGM